MGLQVEELKLRLVEADRLISSSGPVGSLKRNSGLHNSIKRTPPPPLLPPPPLKPLQHSDILKDGPMSGTRVRSRDRHIRIISRPVRLDIFMSQKLYLHSISCTLYNKYIYRFFFLIGRHDTHIKCKYIRR